MTDKIIIDGVDISECTYYLIKDGSCMSQDCECTKCVHNSCYYKDLKLLQNKYDTLTNKFFNSETDKTHLKQENEKLKKEVKQIGSDFIKKGDYARELEKENKELKKENETINYQWHKQSEIGDEWYKIAEKYKFVLEEINLILDELKQQYDYMTDYYEIKEIQDKINEVLK